MYTAVDGTNSGVFPASREALGEARGVSHFVILDGAISGQFHDQQASTLGHIASEPGFSRMLCQTIEGPLDLGAFGLAWCIDKAWGVAWPPDAPRAVVLHASIFPAVDMPLWKLKSLFPSPSPASGLSSLPGLPYKPCSALPVALETHLAPRPFTPTPEWTYAVADDGVPLRDSRHAGQVSLRGALLERGTQGRSPPRVTVSHPVLRTFAFCRSGGAHARRCAAAGGGDARAPVAHGCSPRVVRAPPLLREPRAPGPAAF